MNYGGFPEIYKIADPLLKREILLGYFNTILLKDCIFNHNIRDIKTFQNLTYYLLSASTLPYTYNSLSRATDSNENTVKEFVSVMSDSFLIYELFQFSFSLKKHMKAKKKNYCADNGLISAISFRFSENKGRLFENMVYNELLKTGFTEIYFHNETSECNFILKQNDKYRAVQVCYQLTDNNRKRETDGLKQAMQKYGLSDGIIVTAMQEEEQKGGIAIIPFWKIYSQFT
jgi:uncharacterized protein